ncbi:hypothetical protein B0H17DRAFT_1151547 [Mycena rosella]|uniref:Uncharacterized protein n=1 Tax=Mycena rosella TaxID=1033263 RepID=A0AAD7BJL8_MYCRO|nr:hypothetical protein B0H17DRAFT_1151547 [Mycena rosella]
MDQDLRTQPLDLLRNRDTKTLRGPFDGKVAAFARLGAEHYFITTNADYVPDVPSLQLPHALFLRSDMRYGTDDHTLWPQQWTARYCHLPVIAKKGTCPELDVMWWDPLPQDFVVGSAVTRGLGRLQYRCMAEFIPHINELVERCKELWRTSPDNFSPLFGELIQNILMLTEQLQTLPTTYNKMVFGVTSLQRAWLELDALYNYMTVYRPRISNYMNVPPEHTPLAQCVGAFTSVPSVAQQLWSAQNILAVVPLREPMDMAPDLPNEGGPPVVYSGNSTSDKISAIHRAAAQVPWYCDPFETADTRPCSPSPVTEPTRVASSSRSAARSSNQLPPRSNNQERCLKPYPSKAPTKSPAKIQRDKFSVLAVEEMLPSIIAWADALAQVDQSVAPFTSDPADKRYVLPEPALLVNTTPERRRKFLHHWTMVSDGFLYMLTQPEHAQLLSAQEWRDVLEGLLTKHGHPGSRTYRQSAALEDRIRPALQASNVSSVEGLPVPLDLLPELTLKQTRETVWQVAEINFRFEFASLDRRASQKSRLDEVKACFAGHMLLGVPLEMSQCGWAATAIEERHRYVGRTANLMLDWTTKAPRPDILRRVAICLNWSPSEMQALETPVCRYYTQAFWEYFGCAAVVPLRLDYDVEREDGQL